MKYEITKTFKFDAGHRVPTQEVNQILALTNVNKCRHIHGHEYKVAVTLGSNYLNFGVVTDFNHLNIFKKFLDATFDHRFIIWIDDPLFDLIVGHLLHKTKEEIRDEILAYGKPKIFKDNADSTIAELVESFAIVDFIPTAESIAEYLYEWLEKNIENELKKEWKNIGGISLPNIEPGCRVLKVEVFETSSSSAVFTK